MSQSLGQKLDEFTTSHPRFQEKNLLKTRIELAREILDGDFTDEKRSFLLHRLSYAHTPEEVTELITQLIN